MKKKILALVAIMIMTAVSAMAQQLGGGQQTAPVRWRTTVKMTSATEGVLTLKALVTSGWHLYGTDIPKGGPVATTLNFDASKGVKFTAPFKPSKAPLTKDDKTFGMTLSWWETNVTFTRPFRLTGKAADAEIVGSIRYMSCNDQTCSPPKTENVKLKVK